MYKDALYSCLPHPLCTHPLCTYVGGGHVGYVPGGLVQVGNGCLNSIKLDKVGSHFEFYQRLICGMTWDVVPEQLW